MEVETGRTSSTKSVDDVLGLLCRELEEHSVQLEIERGARLKKLAGNLMTATSILTAAVLSVASPILDSIRQFCGNSLIPQIVLVVVMALIVLPLIAALISCIDAFSLKSTELPGGPEAQCEHFKSEINRLKNEQITQMDIADNISGYLQPLYAAQRRKNEHNQKSLESSYRLIRFSALIIALSSVCLVAVLCSHL